MTTPVSQLTNTRGERIHATYHDHPAEAFYRFQADGVSIAEVNVVLGTRVGIEYGYWLAKQKEGL